jgi:hypothetical protein
VPYKAFAGLVRPYKALGRSLKLVQNDFGKKYYDKAPGGDSEAHGGLIRYLGSLLGSWGPYKALGILIKPLRVLMIRALGCLIRPLGAL